MSSLSLTQLQALASSVGFPDPNLAAAVAMAESGGNPDILGDLTLGTSVGLWQINLAAHPSYTQTELTDPTANAQAALAISSNGTNWNPWTTYRTGAYQQWYSGPPAPSPWKKVGLAAGVAAVASLAIPDVRHVVLDALRSAWRAIA